eukprot:gene6432-8691_t
MAALLLLGVTAVATAQPALPLGELTLYGVRLKGASTDAFIAAALKSGATPLTPPSEGPLSFDTRAAGVPALQRLTVVSAPPARTVWSLAVPSWKSRIEPLCSTRPALKVRVPGELPGARWAPELRGEATEDAATLGGGGFLGSQLCAKLLTRGTLFGPSGEPEPLTEIVLLDAAFARPAPAHATIRVTQFTGDISDRATVFAAAGLTAPATPVASIFHLASMVSGECEERFDDALRVNLDGGRHVFEAARALTAATGARARVVFASSIACYSGEHVSPVNTDATKLTPRTTYGMTKAICELLLNDYSRKGHFDGRTARILAVIRPFLPDAPG